MSYYDRMPFWLYLLEKTQSIVTSLTAGVQLYTRSAGVAYFIVGALGCSFSVKAVKRLIKQPRPIGKSSKKVTYGMPSTHSATITYFAIYITSACLFLPLHHSFDFVSQGVVRSLVPAVVLPWASFILASRVWLGHHTWEQVAAGSGYGAVFAGAWFALWTKGGLSTPGTQMEDWFVSNFSLSVNK